MSTRAEKVQIRPTTRGKSESVTFRIESKALKNLRREAEQKDISTNALVNKLIEDHLNWHSSAAKAGFISVRRPFVSKVIRYLPEQEVISLAESVAKSTNKDSILLMKNEYTIKSALDFLESWIKISDYPYRHEETNNDQNKHSYVVRHDMGNESRWICMYGLGSNQPFCDGSHKKTAYEEAGKDYRYNADGTRIEIK